MDSFKETLKTSLSKLDVLMEDSCKPQDAAKAWGAAFKDPFFDTVVEQKSLSAGSTPATVKGLLSTEAFKEDGRLRGEMQSVEIRGGNRFG
jgi:hypothetical protein